MYYTADMAVRKHIASDPKNPTFLAICREHVASGRRTSRVTLVDKTELLVHTHDAGDDGPVVEVTVR